jgi:RimJ/RimL family protein N-acetyltransferase
VGYWVAPESRGRGVAGAAVRAIVQWAFATLGFERVRARVLVGNDGSAAVLRSCGFHQIEEPVTCGQRGDELPAWQFVAQRSGQQF